MFKLQCLSVCLILALGCAYGVTWDGLVVKFAPPQLDPNKTNSFFAIPMAIGDATKKNYTEVSIKLGLPVKMLCLNGDPRFCPIYDGRGSITGFHVGFPCSDVDDKGIPYDFNRFEVLQKRNISGICYYSATVLTVEPSTVRSGGRLIASTVGTGIWVRNLDFWMQIPILTSQIEQETQYTKQNCIPAMGDHYYYRMTPQLDCRDFYPFFILSTRGQALGMGFQVYGKPSTEKRQWFESINSAAVRATVPRGPECLPEHADTYGVVSLHIYFVKNPSAVTCP